MIVLDANILIRAILGRKVRALIEKYHGNGVQFMTPDEAFHDAEQYLPLLLDKFGKHDVDVSVLVRYLRHLISVVDHDVYSSSEGDARTRLRGRDEEDWPVLASALAFGCAIWTEDTDFFGTGVAVWNTSRIEIFLEAEARAMKGERELSGSEGTEL